MEKVTLNIHNYFDAKLENTKTGAVKMFKAYNQVQDNWFAKLRDSGRNRIAKNISVGDGTGTMSLSRTTLFHRLLGKSVTEESSEVLSHTRFKRVVSVLFTESEAVGNLTEVGLCSGTTNIVTHALFTDSEGNPITIPKTNTDRLTITATVFAEYSLSGPLQRFGEHGDEPRPSTKLDYDNEVGNTVDTSNDYASFAAMLVGCTYGIRSDINTHSGYSFGFSLTHYPAWGPFDMNRLTEAYSKASNAAVTNNLVRTKMYQQISSDEANLSDTYQIKCITMAGYFYLSFPNHDIYPPKHLTFELAGDGSTSGFNLGVPELMTSNVAVTVNGVAVPASDFTFYGRDITKWQGYPSADNRYLIATSIQPSSSSGSYSITMPFLPKRPIMYTGDMPPAEYIYDFETPITIDTLIAPRTAELLYSSDGTTWTSAATLTKTSDSTSEAVSFSPISARYWKLVANVHASDRYARDCLKSGYNLGFFLNKPQLEFNTPPAADALIEVTAYTEYPIKNDKWIIDQTIFDITVERGDSE